jgi:hypothetical protein
MWAFRVVVNSDDVDSLALTNPTLRLPTQDDNAHVLLPISVSSPIDFSPCTRQVKRTFIQVSGMNLRLLLGIFHIFAISLGSIYFIAYFFLFPSYTCT